MAKNNNTELWEQMLSDYRDSGMTATAWCQSKCIKKSTLYYLMRKLKKKSEETDPQTKWALISFPNSQQSVISSGITLKVGDLMLEIASDFDKVALADILSVVMKL